MVTFDHDDPLADTRALTGESADAAGDVAAGAETSFGGSFSLSIAFDRATMSFCHPIFSSTYFFVDKNGIQHLVRPGEFSPFDVHASVKDIHLALDGSPGIDKTGPLVFRFILAPNADIEIL